MSNWDVLAELDPLWTVLSDPQKKFGRWDPAEFFNTGELEAKRVLAMCESKGVSVSYGKLLDFGCGVGRMTRGFSSFFESCTGIDGSAKMIGLARKYNRTASNCEFVTTTSERLPFPDQAFDFVFTVLVLQHIAKKAAILQYIGEFIRVVKEKGVVVFHLPNEVPIRQRIQLRRRLWSCLSSIGVPEGWLFRRLGLAPILMNGISRPEVERFVNGRGATVQAAERFDPNEGAYYSYYYIVTK